MRKNGGNVSSCFCTPDGRVIHAVGGPVSSSKLLEEANWAVALYQEIANFKSPRKQANKVQAAHLEKFGVNRLDFETYAGSLVPLATQDYKQQELWHGETIATILPIKTLARIRAAKQLTMRRGHSWRHSANDAHEIFAAQPLADVTKVGPRVFEELTGEKFRHDRGPVYRAADKVKLAKQTRRPLVLVSFKGIGKNRDTPGPIAQAAIQMAGAAGRTAGLPRPVVVAISQRELAALSQLTDLPTYELQSHTIFTPDVTIVIADPDGKQLVAESADTSNSVDLSALREGLLAAQKAALIEIKAMRGKKRDQELAQR